MPLVSRRQLRIDVLPSVNQMPNIVRNETLSDAPGAEVRKRSANVAHEVVLRVVGNHLAATNVIRAVNGKLGDGHFCGFSLKQQFINAICYFSRRY
jgi:hypothetical protein